jgi:DNA-binding transcriptional ArsR family regulator
VTDGTAALEALGDSTRRRLLEQLRTGEKSVAELTEALPVGQSAVSQHLRVLRGAGLVTDRASGTRRYYRITPDGFAAVRAWVDSFWDDALAAFGDLAAEPDPTPASSPEETS